MSNKKTTNFDKNFKYCIAREILAGRLKKGIAASNISVTTGTISRWLREYKESGYFEVDTSFTQHKNAQIVKRAMVLIEQQSDLLLLCKGFLNSNSSATGTDPLKSLATLERLLRALEEGVEPASNILHELPLLLNQKDLDTTGNIT